MAPGILPMIELIVSQLYITELESPPKIDEFITIAYNTFVDLLLHQLIAVKTAGTYILFINL